jgi:hypothetical protein
MRPSLFALAFVLTNSLAAQDRFFFSPVTDDFKNIALDADGYMVICVIESESFSNCRRTCCI